MEDKTIDLISKDRKLSILKDEIVNHEHKSVQQDELVEQLKHDNLKLSEKCQQIEVHIHSKANKSLFMCCCCCRPTSPACSCGGVRQPNRLR